jgi:septum formation protein
MENDQRPQAITDGLNSNFERMRPLVLASASPRRAEILSLVGWPFEVSISNIDESIKDSETASSYVERLAKEKAMFAAQGRLFGLILGADTVVTIDNIILGKPKDAEDARHMLKILSGRWHEVLTGIAIFRVEDGLNIAAHERTRVRFKELSDSEIDWYISTGETMDKAGAYAVQGKAAIFIEKIEGDYWNVVGLPIQLVYKLAQQIDTKGSK